MNALNTSNSPAPSSPGRSQVQRSETPSSASRPQERPEQTPRTNLDSARISQEAARPESSGGIPNFAAAFGQARPVNPASGGTELAQPNGVSQGLQQGRVIASQTPTALGLRTSEAYRRSVGGVGGAGAAFLAGENLLRGDYAAAAANGAHAFHGLVGQAAGNLPPAPPPTSALAALPQIPGQARELASNLTSANRGEILARLAQSNGLTAAANGSRLTQAATLAGRAAPALGGALQAFSPNSQWDERLSGGAKLIGAGMIASGIGAPVGAGLIAGSTLYDGGRLLYGPLSNTRVIPSEMSPLGVTSPDGSPIGA